MFHRLYVHVCWTTRGRVPLIDLKVAEFLDRFVPCVARQERADVLALGQVSTHVHLLLRLHPTTRIPHLIQKLKGGSATIATAEGLVHPNRPLRWAKGYSLSSVSERALPIVHEYVLDQAAHHPRERIEGWAPDAHLRLAESLARAERNQRKVPRSREPAAVASGNGATANAALAADAEPRL